MTEENDFDEMVLDGISKGLADPEFRALTLKWMTLSGKYGYSYRSKFMGVPIIQLPGDIVAIQTLIFDVRPDIVVETGIARGGSLIMSAAFLALLDICDGVYSQGVSLRKAIGIDREIRPHTYQAIQASPFRSYIAMIEGDSNDMHTVTEVEKMVGRASRVLVFLDSNHTHEHVYAELVNYSRFVNKGSYVVVFDTSIEFDNSETWVGRRSWGMGNSPHTALKQFLDSEHGRDFVIDRMIDSRIEMTVCRDGFLKRAVSDISHLSQTVIT